MYGQKTSFGLVSAGITAASWWMFGVTIVLAAIAAILLVRVFSTVLSRDEARRP
jgi:hypothetical protein